MPKCQSACLHWHVEWDAQVSISCKQQKVFVNALMWSTLFTCSTKKAPLTLFRLVWPVYRRQAQSDFALFMKLGLSLQLLFRTSQQPSFRLGFLRPGVHGVASLSRRAASASEKSSRRAQTHQDNATQQIQPNGGNWPRSLLLFVALSHVPCPLACVTLLRLICRRERSPDKPSARRLINLGLMLSDVVQLRPVLFVRKEIY